jgi:hypothetical protein
MKKKQFLLPVLALILASIFITSCKKDEVINIPSLTTAVVTNITSTSATFGGEIIDNGGGDVSASGVVYNTSAAPVIETNPFIAGAPVSGAYELNVTGLAPNTTYYVRSYATNSAGTSYGNEVSFTTLP